MTILNKCDVHLSGRKRSDLSKALNQAGLGLSGHHTQRRDWKTPSTEEDPLKRRVLTWKIGENVYKIKAVTKNP